MATVTSHDVLDDVLELAELLRPTWATISQDLLDSGVPLNEGDGDGDGDQGGDAGGDAGDAGDAGTQGDGGDDGDQGDGDGKTEPDWKAMARKHERRAKAERKAREDAERKLSERDDATKSDHEKALEKARQEARQEALSAGEKERRKDRLEVAVTRAAARSFADVDDALVHIQRAIEAGDVDADDIFDSEGKVQTDALKTALDELLDRKPHLKAGAGRPAGDADGGKGDGGGKSTEDMSVDEHLKAVQSR
jgi:hypothetical protein